MGRIGTGSATTQVDLLYNPYQQAFLEARRRRLPNGKRAYRRLALISGRRGGKTLICAVAAVEEASVPNTLGWACAPTYPKLQDYVIPAIMAALPHQWIRDIDREDHRLILKNDSQIVFRSLDDPERARGPGLDWAWIDEGRDIQHQAYKTMVPALVDKGGVAFVGTSPNGFDWIYRTFWLPAVNGDRGYWACRYRTIDNPWIALHAADELEAARRELDPLFYKQEFEADFVTFEGAVYGEMIESQILKTDEEIRRVWPEYPGLDVSRPAIAGLDPGADHPFAGVVLMATEEGLVVVGEYLKRERAAYDHAINLKQMTRGLAPEQWAIDRSQKQMALELGQHGIWASAASNNVVAGIQRVGSWLRSGRLWLPEPVCPKLIEGMRGYMWAPNTSGAGEAKREQVRKIDDDLPDALRYALMLWPELPTAADTNEATGRRPPRQAPGQSAWEVARLQRCEALERGEEVEDEGLETLSVGLGPDEEGIGQFYG